MTSCAYKLKHNHLPFGFDGIIIKHIQSNIPYQLILVNDLVTGLYNCLC